MAGIKEVAAALVAFFLLPALAWRASAQEPNTLSLGTFHSPKGIGLCLETQKEDSSFDSIDIIVDMFGILRGEYSSPGIKATYYRNIILRQYESDGCLADFYAGPGVTAGYVRDIHEPFSAVAGMAGALYGLSMAKLVPAKFSFNESINVLVFVVLGGIGNIPGSIGEVSALALLIGCAYAK